MKYKLAIIFPIVCSLLLLEGSLLNFFLPKEGKATLVVDLHCPKCLDFLVKHEKQIAKKDSTQLRFLPLSKEAHLTYFAAWIAKQDPLLAKRFALAIAQKGLLEGQKIQLPPFPLEFLQQELTCPPQSLPIFYWNEKRVSSKTLSFLLQEDLIS